MNGRIIEKNHSFKPIQALLCTLKHLKAPTGILELSEEVQNPTLLTCC